MRYEAEIKELLIENAIHLIAEGGFEKATTKELTHSGGQLPDFKMNEVYIYRFFKSKENLYEAAFVRLDTELFYAFKRGVEIIGGFENDRKEKLGKFFSMAWQFVLGNEERCRCYVRYYIRSISRDILARLIESSSRESSGKCLQSSRMMRMLKLYYTAFLPQYLTLPYMCITMNLRIVISTVPISSMCSIA